MTSGHYMNFISLQYGASVLGVENVKLVKPHVCTVSNVGLLYAKYLIKVIPITGRSNRRLMNMRKSTMGAVTSLAYSHPQVLYTALANILHKQNYLATEVVEIIMPKRYNNIINT